MRLKYLLFLLSFVFLFSLKLSATVRILTFHCNHPEFLEYQCMALKKFLLDEYELIVMNDGVNPKEQKAIQAVCERYNVKNIPYEPLWHTSNSLNWQVQNMLNTSKGNDFFCFPFKNGFPDIQKIYENVSIRHCHLIQYALDHFGYNHDDIVVIMDGDVFFLQPLSIRALLAEKDIVGINSEFRDKQYLWVPFIAFNPKNLPNLHDLKFHVDLIDGVVCDTGSHSHNYLKKNPGVNYHLYPRRPSSDFFPYDRETFSKFGLEDLSYSSINWPSPMEFYVDYHLLHFCGGSGLHQKSKFKNIAEIMELILHENVPEIQE